MSLTQLRIDAAYWQPLVQEKEKEAQVYAVTLASVSAALLGILQPGMPFEGNQTSVAEAMRLRRALFMLARELEVEKARGRYDVELKDVEETIKRVEQAAAAEIRIIYRPPEDTPAQLRPGKETPP
jgi:hypothetical protein